MKKTIKSASKPMVLSPRGSVVPFWQGLVKRENIPEALKKVGIHGISDNLKPGQQLYIPGKTIFDFFGEEIIEALNKIRQEKKNQD